MNCRLLLTAVTFCFLTGCGDNTPAASADKLLDQAVLADRLPPEAQAVVTSYTGDLRAAAAAYRAEFGQLPESFADVASVADARAAAVNLLADGLAEQVPFASRETVNRAANGIVVAAERRILDQMRTENAPNL